MDTTKENEFLVINEVKIPKDLRFLVVEDEPDIQELLVDTLEEIGFSGQIEFSDNVEAAIDISVKALKDNNRPIDFFISDWNLIDLSGLDFLITLREHSAYKNTPFLMVTANDNVSGMLVATKKGASEYLVKPWDQEELAQKIAACWEKRLPSIPTT
jgi:two-component system chemotaxis response regulator CheY